MDNTIQRNDTTESNFSINNTILAFGIMMMLELNTITLFLPCFCWVLCLDNKTLHNHRIKVGVISYNFSLKTDSSSDEEPDGDRNDEFNIQEEAEEEETPEIYVRERSHSLGHYRVSTIQDQIGFLEGCDIEVRNQAASPPSYRSRAPSYSSQPPSYSDTIFNDDDTSAITCSQNSCQAGFQLKGKGCYKIYTNLASGDQAKQICETDGYSLASLYLKESYEAVNEWLNSGVITDSCLLNGAYDTAKKRWYWNTKFGPVEFDFNWVQFAVGEPNNVSYF
ncbi:DgyrCDS10140 [Dimorphilus gyrociliatus]|uniref:DgyrCDS10140 n=1 Tax=Dimorphilus gyrociliatus TaxID=2664684 RepID=A0A7I8W0H7_9ANNE|nr:DgyrCDS10140 [Dimorphilus gyrociliatus]